MKFQIRARQDGSLGIPINFRHRLGIQPGTLVEVTTDRQNRIYLKPMPAVCSCCGENRMAVSSVDGMCPACNQLVELYIRDGMDMISAIRKARRSGRDEQH